MNSGAKVSGFMNRAQLGDQRDICEVAGLALGIYSDSIIATLTY